MQSNYDFLDQESLSSNRLNTINNYNSNQNLIKDHESINNNSNNLNNNITKRKLDSNTDGSNTSPASEIGEGIFQPSLHKSDSKSSLSKIQEIIPKKISNLLRSRKKNFTDNIENSTQNIITYHLLRRTDFFHSGATEKRINRIKEIKQNTFENLKQKQNPIQIQGTSFYYIPQNSKIRKILFEITHHPIFEVISFLLTILNVVLYIVKINSSRTSFIRTFYFYFEIFFIIVIGISIICKIIALGFIAGRYSYLRSSIWNAIDFCIILSSALLFYWLNISVMRGFIFFSLLDSISFFTPLKAMVYSLTKSISLMRGTLVFLLFTFFVFSITGVDLFHRSLSRICMTTDGKRSDPILYCSKYQEIGFVCPNDMVCVVGQGNPNNGMTSFDNLFNAFITVFQIISISSWTEIYYALAKTESPYVTTIWFVVLIFLVTFVCINMFVVSIKMVFVEFRLLQFEKSILPTFVNSLKNIFLSIPQALSNFLVHHSFITLIIAKFPFLHNPVNKLKKAKGLLYRFVISYFFDFLVCVVIGVNFLLELINQLADFPTHIKDFMEVVAIFVLFLFTVELFLKIISFGIIEFFTHRLNQLDFLIVFVSIIIRIIIYTTKADESSSIGLQILSILRMLRFFGVLHRLQPFQILLGKIFNSVLPTIVLILFISLIVLAFSTISHQLYANLLNDYRNFDTIVNSFITLFAVLTGDNWHIPMYQGALIEATNLQEWLSKLLSIPFFLLYWFVSNVLLVSLFIAIVLESFEQTQHSSTSWITLMLKYIIKKAKYIQDKIFGIDTRNYIKKRINLYLHRFRLYLLEKFNIPYNNKSKNVEKKKSRLQIFFINTFRFRKFIQNFVLPNRRFSKYYSIVTTATALIGTLPLFFESSTNADLTNAKSIPIWLMVYDYVCLALYSSEFFFRFFAIGIIFFLDPFNNLDAIILLELLIACIMYPILGLKAEDQIMGGALRGLRAFRPLKLLAKLPDFSIYLNATFKSVYDLIQVSFLSAGVIFLFSLLGNHLFKGLHEYCTDRNIITFEYCHGMYLNSKGIYAPRAWKVFNSNFNNIFQSMMTLFEVSTRSRWSEIMQPTIYQRDGTINKWSFIFFFFFILTLTYFFMNLIIAVIQSNVDRERGVSSLTSSQRSYLKLIQDIVHMRPERKKRIWSNLSFFKLIDKILSSSIYKVFRIVAVIIACICLASQYGTMTDLYKLLVGDIPGYIFSLYVAIELILILLAYGISSWWKNWNRIEVLIFAISLPILLIFGTLKIVDPTTSYLYIAGKGISRTLLLIRIFRVGSHISSVGFMLKTLIVCIPSIFSTLILLIIIMFAYSIFGMAFFGNIKYQFTVNGDANYRTLFNSMMVLFRVLTVDTWNNFLYECKIDAPYCTRIPGVFSDCGSRWSPVFYITFILIGSRVILNLFIGILLDNFSHTFQDSQFSIGKKDLIAFVKVWKNYDPNATGYIPIKLLPNIVDNLYRQNKRLGLNLNSNHEKELYWVMKFEILQGVVVGGTDDKIYSYLRWDPIYKIKSFFHQFQTKKKVHHVYFNDVLIALCRIHIGIEDMSYEAIVRRRQFLNKSLRTISQSKIQAMINDRLFKLKLKKIALSNGNFLNLKSKNNLLIKSFEKDFIELDPRLQDYEGDAITIKPESIGSALSSQRNSLRFDNHKYFDDNSPNKNLEKLNHSPQNNLSKQEVINRIQSLNNNIDIKIDMDNDMKDNLYNFNQDERIQQDSSSYISSDNDYVTENTEPKNNIWLKQKPIYTNDYDSKFLYESKADEYKYPLGTINFDTLPENQEYYTSGANMNSTPQLNNYSSPYSILQNVSSPQLTHSVDPIQKYRQYETSPSIQEIENNLDKLYEMRTSFKHVLLSPTTLKTKNITSTPKKKSKQKSTATPNSVLKKIKKPVKARKKSVGRKLKRSSSAPLTRKKYLKIPIPPQNLNILNESTLGSSSII